MHVESRETRYKAESWADFVVHAGEVCPVSDIESFCGDLYSRFFSQLVLPAQARVEIHIIRSKASVAGSADRTLVGRVIVSIHFSTGQQVKRMSAVIGKNRSQLEASYDASLPWTIKHAGNDNLVTLIEFRQATVEAKVRRILWSIVTVEIRGGIKS